MGYPQDDYFDCTLSKIVFEYDYFDCTSEEAEDEEAYMEPLSTISIGMLTSMRLSADILEDLSSHSDAKEFSDVYESHERGEIMKGFLFYDTVAQFGAPLLGVRSPDSH